MKNSLASASTVAYMLYRKYANGMPLYRQEQEWKTYGLTLSRATLANWVIRPAAQWFKPLYEAMRRHMLSEPVIHADETEVQVLKEPGRTAKTASRMWVYCTGSRSETPIVLYEYQPTRSGEHAKRWLTGFKEDLIRPFLVGRKNWLFFDTTKGAEASALCYSILEAAKANSLHVYLYLLYLLTEIPQAKALDDDVLCRYYKAT